MKYFNLYSNILTTKGVTRTLISDLQRNVSELIPLEFFDVLELFKTNSIDDVFSQYDNESHVVLKEYLEFLLEKELGFITLDSWDTNFLPLDYNYEDYNILSDLYIEINKIEQLTVIKESIVNLAIRHLVIYSVSNLFVDELLSIDKLFSNTPIESIQIFSPFHKEINNAFLNHINNETSRIYNIVFYNCNAKPLELKKYRFSTFFTKENIDILSCGKVDLKYFNTNLPKVLEAFNFNSCLYKKIGIEIDGNIRNCPAMPQSFGNIKDSTLEKALKHKDFRKYWNLTKDKIEICKDCEFRYICTDCRAYTERTHTNEQGLDISKPLKCGYNPSTGEWQEWSKNPLKEKAINYYGMQHLKTK